MKELTERQRFVHNCAVKGFSVKKIITLYLKEYHVLISKERVKQILEDASKKIEAQIFHFNSIIKK